MTSTANVGEILATPVTCFVCGPWNAVSTGLKSSASGSAASTAASTSSFTRRDDVGRQQALDDDRAVRVEARVHGVGIGIGGESLNRRGHHARR